eukprot:4048079-Prymnesium_polylepis.1
MARQRHTAHCLCCAAAAAASAAATTSSPTADASHGANRTECASMPKCGGRRGGAHILALLDGHAHDAWHRLHPELLHRLARLLLAARLLGARRCGGRAGGRRGVRRNPSPRTGAIATGRSHERRGCNGAFRLRACGFDRPSSADAALQPSERLRRTGIAPLPIGIFQLGHVLVVRVLLVI